MTVRKPVERYDVRLAKCPGEGTREKLEILLAINTIREVADMIGCSNGTVKNIMRREGVRSPRKSRRRKRRVFHDIDPSLRINVWEELQNLYKQYAPVEIVTANLRANPVYTEQELMDRLRKIGREYSRGIGRNLYVVR